MLSTVMISSLLSDFRTELVSKGKYAEWGFTASIWTKAKH